MKSRSKKPHPIGIKWFKSLCSSPLFFLFITSYKDQNTICLIRYVFPHVYKPSMARAKHENAWRTQDISNTTSQKYIIRIKNENMKSAHFHPDHGNNSFDKQCVSGSSRESLRVIRKTHEDISPWLYCFYFSDVHKEIVLKKNN